MITYKKTIINNINKHFKKIIGGCLLFIILCILFYVIKYYKHKTETFKINWDALYDFSEQQKITNFNPKDISINPGNLDFNLKCDKDSVGLRQLCETCHINYNTNCFKGNTKNICDMILNSKQCENKCGFASPRKSNNYISYSVNNSQFVSKDFNLKTYNNIYSLHQCEKLCDLNKNCQSYKYSTNSKSCSLSSTKVIKPSDGYVSFEYGTPKKLIDITSQDPNYNTFIGIQNDRNYESTCYTKYNSNETCINKAEVNTPFFDKKVLDYKECEKLCNNSNGFKKCEGYTFKKKNIIDTVGNCKLYERFRPSDGCKQLNQLDSLYKDGGDDEYTFQSGIKHI